MGKTERRLLLAYVNSCRQITCCDKRLHRDFFCFNMILKEEFNSPLELDFEIINGPKGKANFENEPFSQDLEVLVSRLVQEGKLAFVEAGSIDITREGYEELVELHTTRDSIPSVRNLLSGMGDEKYREKYRSAMENME